MQSVRLSAMLTNDNRGSKSTFRGGGGGCHQTQSKSSPAMKSKPSVFRRALPVLASSLVVPLHATVTSVGVDTTTSSRRQHSTLGTSIGVVADFVPLGIDQK